MKESIYIFTNGTLKRKDNSLVYITEANQKKYIPVENVREIMVFGETTINNKLLVFLAQKEIILSYFNYHGYYSGSFYPREHYNSGFMILSQATAYNNPEHRLKIAKQFVMGAAQNSLKIISYYINRDKDLDNQKNEIISKISEIDAQKNINELMSVEGKIKQIYYSCFNNILNQPDFTFSTRNKRPPKDFINALISFSNSLIYTIVLSEIYQTHLDPRIGFLHATNSRRFSLNLDIAEIFKPIIGDRLIFSLINKRIITPDCFEKNSNGILLNNKGKQNFLKQFQLKLEQTIKYPKLKRNVSYRQLIRLEIYKLEKDIIQEKNYEPFIVSW
ncbi:MAG: type I-B CRISPR-associated endonuclease Cas1 [Candidatus Marinimicrobia bacterium]|nr:type I-B CRISPR-associated endonuclease Cas1 [Candidatus Neomarinimicrobiota bacterium]